MAHSIISRVVPEVGAFEAPSKPSQEPPCQEEEGVITIISNGRNQTFNPAATKAWVSDAVPPGSSADLSAPATAVRYYRQQRDFDYPHGTPALLAWIAGLMCMIPRLGPGGLRDSAGARSDSVDFVTTWHRAQAEGAARRVMPVLKRANAAEFNLQIPNTPEQSIRETTPVEDGVEFTEEPATVLQEGIGVEVGGGHSSSFAAPAQRPLSTHVPSSCASSGDLLPFLLDNLPQGAPFKRPVSQPDSHQSGKRSVRFN